jgi:hypothetical protein
MRGSPGLAKAKPLSRALPLKTGIVVWQMLLLNAIGYGISSMSSIAYPRPQGYHHLLRQH